MTAKELKQKHFEPISYVIDGLIPEGVTLLVGKPKTGKSWLALDIAIAVATGGECLGHAVPRPGDVLYLALEDNERRLNSRLEKLLGSEDGPERLEVYTKWEDFDHTGLIDIQEWAALVPNPRLVIIDVLARVRKQGNGIASYSADYEALKDIQSWSGKTGIPVIVNHQVQGLSQVPPSRRNDTISHST